MFTNPAFWLAIFFFAGAAWAVLRILRLKDTHLSRKSPISKKEIPMQLKIETVGELRWLLRNADDDTPLTVAACPDVHGSTNNFLDIKHEDEDGIVLALAEECNEERTLVFKDDKNVAVRPV